MAEPGYGTNCAVARSGFGLAGQGHGVQIRAREAIVANSDQAQGLNCEPIQSWLQKTLKTAGAWNLVSMAAGLLGGLLVLFVSFWVAYGVIWFISHSLYVLSDRAILLVAGGFMTLVVIVGARQNWESLDPLEQQVRLADQMDITLSPWNRYGVAYDTDALKAGAFEVRSVASTINCILCGGVLLCLGSLGKLRRFRRMRRINVAECARVIALLRAAARRQSYAEIVEKLPGLNPVNVFDDLRYIDGVLFLAREPSGLTLIPELKSELNSLAISD